MTKFSDVLAAGVTIRESANDGSDFSNPAADYRRLFLGEDGLLHVKDSSGTVTDPYTSSSAVAGKILGRTFYAAGSDAQLASTTSSSMADIDGTNAIVTFTAPTSTNVVVEIGMYGGTDAAANMHLGIRESTTNIVKGLVIGGGSQNIYFTRKFLVTGISAGSHTYKAAWSVSTSTGRCYTGPNHGHLVMVVYDAG